MLQNFDNKDKTTYFIGEVIKPISIYSKDDEHAPEFLKTSSEDSAIVSYQFYRYILFLYDQQNKVLDLLYDSPSYPVYPNSGLQECLSSSILIQNVQAITPEQLAGLKEQLFIPKEQEGVKRKALFITDSLKN